MLPDYSVNHVPGLYPPPPNDACCRQPRIRMQLWAAAVLLMRQSAAAPQLLFMEAAAAEAHVRHSFPVLQINVKSRSDNSCRDASSVFTAREPHFASAEG